MKRNQFHSIVSTWPSALWNGSSRPVSFAIRFASTLAAQTRSSFLHTYAGCNDKQQPNTDNTGHFFFLSFFFLDVFYVTGAQQ
ncbi:Uncharacterized protein APZ42_026478 [Daphnia magna]|uniref:Uncharacterized protein n=1 Tax=Daphnia magna TaxID=35525 RepID=A0A162DB29_9CRUS|nr:Uncharacterized protein APZ42_026478 [Daphnia magna]